MYMHYMAITLVYIMWVYITWANQRRCQYCIPTCSKGQSSAFQYSTVVEITPAGSNAMLFEQSASTSTSMVESCCASNRTRGVGLETKIERSASLRAVLVSQLHPSC